MDDIYNPFYKDVFSGKTPACDHIYVLEYPVTQCLRCKYWIRLEEPKNVKDQIEYTD